MGSRNVAVAAVAILLPAVVPGAGGAAGGEPSLVVRSPEISVTVSDAGGISSVRFRDGREWKLGGRSVLTDGPTGAADSCEPEGSAAVIPNGGAEWRTVCTDGAGRTSTVTERLTPTPSSVSWTVSVLSGGDTYAKGIWTKLSGWADDHTRSFWTTWGTSPYSAPGAPPWSDPLRPAPFADLDLPYGGNALTGQNGFSVPLATILEPDTDHALSLVQSLDDVLLDARLRTTTAGDVELGRFYNRLAPGAPVTFEMDLVPTAADWRPVLGWTAERYAGHFKPTTPDVQDLAGLGTYSFLPGPFSDSLRETLRARHYRTNWELSLRGPYMGEFMPPVDTHQQTWPSFIHRFWPQTPSTESLESWGRILDYWADADFENLAYFNVTEFGADISDPAPPRRHACDDPARWTDANDHLNCDFPQAVLRDKTGRPSFSWYSAVAMDPGDPAYQRHLLDQATALLDRLPQYRGINIDRLDWLMRFNPHADDGVSWYEGASARSLITSWKQLMPKLQAVVHGRGKQLWVSPTAAKRIDWMKGVDGVFSEFNAGDMAMNLDAFMGLEKPIIGWNWNLGSDPDAFIQRYLYMGVFPMSDTPINNHGMSTSPSVQQYFADYGEMFRTLSTKRWVYTPHAVKVDGGDALANAFSVADGVVVPVVHGGDHARLDLRGLEQVKPDLDLSRAEYIQPGQTTWRPLPTERLGGTVRVDVPLLRGAAMVRFGNGRAASQSVELDLAMSSQSVSQIEPVTVTATVRNGMQRDVTGVTARLDVPEGWTVVPIDKMPNAIAAGGQATVRWRVTAPDAAAGTVGELRARVEYREGPRSGAVSDARRVTAGKLVPREQILATDAAAISGYPAANALDGDDRSTWRSASRNMLSAPAITLDLRRTYDLAGVTVLPQQDGQIGDVFGQYRVYLSSDGATYTKVVDGTWRFDMGLRAAPFVATGVRYLRLEATNRTCQTAALAEINVVTAADGTGGGKRPADSGGQQTSDPLPPFEHLVPQAEMAATTTSYHPGFEAGKAIDGDCQTMWHTKFSPNDPLPQSITLDLGRSYDSIAVLYQPRSDGYLNGNITEYDVFTSLDGQSFTQVGHGQWADDATVKYAEWAPSPARYIRLTARSGFGGWASAAEINIAYAPDEAGP